MTKTALASRELDTKKEIAKEDRDQRERASKRDAAAKIISGGLKAAPWKMLNNPEWYKRYVPSDVNTNLPSFIRNGALIKDASGYNLLGDNATDYYNSNPGIMVIPFIDTFGSQIGDHKCSAINEGLKRFMAQLRKFNSRVGDYEPADIGLYLIATTEIGKLLEFIRKALSAYKFYRSESLYSAKHIITALGFDYDDMVNHYPEYKYAISKAIKRFNTQLVLPKGLSFVDRKLWLAKLCVQDHDGEKAGIYITRPVMTWRFSPSETSITPYVLPNGTSTTRLTYSALFGATGYVTYAFQTLVESNSVQVMMADLRAGIPESDFIKLDDFDPSAVLDPVVSHETLEQIHNLETLIGSVSEGSVGYQSFDLNSASDGYLWHGAVNSSGDPITTSPATIQITFNSGSAFANTTISDYFLPYRTKPLILNFFKDSVNGDDILEATRLKYAPYYTWVAVTGGSARVETTTDHWATEAILRLEIYTYDATATTELHMHSAYTYELVNQNVFSTNPFIQDALASRFDWCPLIKHVGNISLNANFLSGELDNYFPLPRNVLYRLHEQSILSMFYLSDKTFSGFRH